MCGICGIYDFDIRNFARPIELEKMLRAIVHRGAEQQRMSIDKNIELGTRRLNIIDLTRAINLFLTNIKALF